MDHSTTGANPLASLASYIEHLGGHPDLLSNWTAVPWTGKSVVYISPEKVVYHTKASVAAALPLNRGSTAGRNSSAVVLPTTESAIEAPRPTVNKAPPINLLARIDNASVGGRCDEDNKDNDDDDDDEEEEDGKEEDGNDRGDGGGGGGDGGSNEFESDGDDDDDDNDDPFTFMRTASVAEIAKHFTRLETTTSLFSSLFIDDEVANAGKKTNNGDMSPPLADNADIGNDELDITLDSDHDAEGSQQQPSKAPAEDVVDRPKKRAKRPIYTREREALERLDSERTKGSSDAPNKSKASDGSRSISASDRDSAPIQSAASGSSSARGRGRVGGSTGKKKQRQRSSSASSGHQRKRRQKHNGADVESTANLLAWVQDSVLPALTTLISLEIEADKAQGMINNEEAFAAINYLNNTITKIPIGLSGTNAGVDATLQSVRVAAQNRSLRDLQAAASSLAEFCLAATMALQL